MFDDDGWTDLFGEYEPSELDEAKDDLFRLAGRDFKTIKELIRWVVSELQSARDSRDAAKSLAAKVKQDEIAKLRSIAVLLTGDFKYVSSNDPAELHATIVSAISASISEKGDLRRELSRSKRQLSNRRRE